MSGYYVIFLLAIVYGIAGFIGWMHDSPKNFSDFIWQHGECRNWVARQNRITGKTEFLVYDQFHNPHYYPFSFRYWREFKPKK